MAKPKQVDMFEQGKIKAVEKWADVYDEKRDLINGLTEEMKNAAFKLSEAMHENADKVEKADGNLVYMRGDYKVVVKHGKESVNVKIKRASKGAEPGAADEQAEE